MGSGTLITFPTLLAFGVPPVTANVSNTVGLVPGTLSGAAGLPRASSSASGGACSASARPRCWAGSSGAVLLLWLPSSAFDAIVPVLVALGVVLVAIGPAVQKRVAARHERTGGLPEHGAGWVWPAIARRRACTAATSAPPRACC